MIDEATTGHEALEMAQNYRPDLIVMDLRLPDLDGLAVTKALKADQMTQRIPVIALTAFAMEGDREKALQAGCDGYITKPIDTQSFPAAVRRFLVGEQGKGVALDYGNSHEDPGRR